MTRSGGQFGTLLKEQGSHDLDISLKGTWGLSKRLKYIGTGMARTHLLYYSMLFYLLNASPVFKS